jgi:hypothetical protein
MQDRPYHEACPCAPRRCARRRPVARAVVICQRGLSQEGVEIRDLTNFVCANAGRPFNPTAAARGTNHHRPRGVASNEWCREAVIISIRLRCVFAGFGPRPSRLVGPLIIPDVPRPKQMTPQTLWLSFLRKSHDERAPYRTPTYRPDISAVRLRCRHANHLVSKIYALCPDA